MNSIKIFPLLIAFYEILIYLSNDMYLPALPQITQDLATTTQLTQLSLTAWFLGSASMQLILGPISDRIGRRPVLLGSGLIFIIASMVCAITSSIDVLLIARFFQGCAVCAVMVAGYSSIHELFDQKTAIRVMAVMGSIIILAPAFGPLAGSAVLSFANWRDIFFLLALLTMIVILALWKWMPESLAHDKRQPIHFGTITKNYGKILTNAPFMLYAGAFCLTFLAMISWLAMGPFLVTNSFKYSSLYFSIAQALVFSGYILGARLVKIGLAKLGMERLLATAFIIIIVGGLLAGIMAYFLPGHLPCFISALIIFSFGTAFSFACLQRLAIDAATEPMGLRLAIFSTLMSGTAVLGSLLASVLYNGTTLVLGGIFLATAILASFLFRLVNQRQKHLAE